MSFPDHDVADVRRGGHVGAVSSVMGAVGRVWTSQRLGMEVEGS